MSHSSWFTYQATLRIFKHCSSKAVVPVLFLFCVASGLYHEALHVLKSSRVLCPRVSSFLLAF